MNNRSIEVMNEVIKAGMKAMAGKIDRVSAYDFELAFNQWMSDFGGCVFETQEELNAMDNELTEFVKAAT